MIEILEQILKLIYPPVCSICGKLNKKALCNKCKIKLDKEFNYQTDDYSEDSEKNFAQHHYFFQYKDLIRSQILALKFHEKPYIYQTMSYFLENKRKSFENLKKYDIITIVPVSKEREKTRGYNQSELIAKEISKMLLIKFCKNILYKTKDTLPQSTLNKEQREQNVIGVYTAQNIEKIINKTVLIIDDIYTTGNTVNECAKVLVRKGISRNNIGVLTIAKD